MWQELREAMRWADSPEVQAVVLAGAGKNFCAGIDLAMLGGVAQAVAHADPARSREALRQLILDLQDCLSQASRPAESRCWQRFRARASAALDMVTCCDMRYAAADAVFSVKEVDVRHDRRRGHAAAPAAYGARRCRANWPIPAATSMRLRRRTIGLVNRVFPDARGTGGRHDADRAGDRRKIAAGHPRQMLNYGRDHSVADGLELHRDVECGDADVGRPQRRGDGGSEGKAAAALHGLKPQTTRAATWHRHSGFAERLAHLLHMSAGLNFMPPGMPGMPCITTSLASCPACRAPATWR